VKICINCQAERDAFFFNDSFPSHIKGLDKICLSCFSEHDFQDILARQGNKEGAILCAICRTREGELLDSEDGKVRGIICCDCEGLLEVFEGETRRLLEAAAYLRKYEIRTTLRPSL
jgi:hypothetical protein